MSGRGPGAPQAGAAHGPAGRDATPSRPPHAPPAPTRDPAARAGPRRRARGPRRGRGPRTAPGRPIVPGQRAAPGPPIAAGRPTRAGRPGRPRGTRHARRREPSAPARAGAVSGRGGRRRTGVLARLRGQLGAEPVVRAAGHRAGPVRGDRGPAGVRADDRRVRVRRLRRRTADRAHRARGRAGRDLRPQRAGPRHLDPADDDRRRPEHHRRPAGRGPPPVADPRHRRGRRCCST